MADSATPPDAPPAKAWKRYVLIGVPLAVVAGVILLIFWDEIRVRGWINRLSSSDARVRREQLDALRGHEDTDLVDRLLLEAVEDDDKTFDVRSTCARLLLDRQRLPQLEAAFARGSVETRGLILKAFSREQWFKKFVEDQGGAVEETVRAWLREGTDRTRSHAIQLAVSLDLSDLMPEIRALLEGQRAANVHPDLQRNLIISAAGAAERFKDCASIPRILELARTHEHPLVRLRTMQVIDRTVFRSKPICPDAVSGEDMGALVSRALDDDDRAVRMGAMLVLGRTPEWAPDATARLQEILDSDANGAERRQALDTLVALGDPEFLDLFPRYFHDPLPEVRSSAVRAAPMVKDPPLTGGLVGILQDEVESDVLFTDAAKMLSKAAGGWMGLPENLRARPVKDPTAWNRDLNTLFTRGEVQGLTRDAFAEGWFRWWAAKLGLAPEEVEKAVAVRAAFLQAKSNGDAAAAEKALDGVDVSVPQGLFVYERGWLQTR